MPPANSSFVVTPNGAVHLVELALHLGTPDAEGSLPPSSEDVLLRDIFALWDRCHRGISGTVSVGVQVDGFVVDATSRAHLHLRRIGLPYAGYTDDVMVHVDGGRVVRRERVVALGDVRTAYRALLFF